MGRCRKPGGRLSLGRKFLTFNHWTAAVFALRLALTTHCACYNLRVSKARKVCLDRPGLTVGSIRAGVTQGALRLGAGLASAARARIGSVWILRALAQKLALVLIVSDTLARDSGQKGRRTFVTPALAKVRDPLAPDALP